MKTVRLEAFSDGVIAILITIMVLEFKVPDTAAFDALRPLLPIFLSYLLSFIYLGIYWNNHHHMFHLVEEVSGPMMWWNHLLLFFLSLIPFTTAWMGERQLSTLPTALYGLNLLLCSLAFYFLEQSIIKAQGRKSLLKKAVGDDFKGRMSPAIYLIGIVFAFFWPVVAAVLYSAVALWWIIPDKRMEEVECKADHKANAKESS